MPVIPANLPLRLQSVPGSKKDAPRPLYARLREAQRALSKLSPGVAPAAELRTTLRQVLQESLTELQRGDGALGEQLRGMASDLQRALDGALGGATRTAIPAPEADPILVLMAQVGKVLARQVQEPLELLALRCQYQDFYGAAQHKKDQAKVRLLAAYADNSRQRLVAAALLKGDRGTAPGRPPGERRPSVPAPAQAHRVKLDEVEYAAIAQLWQNEPSAEIDRMVTAVHRYGLRSKRLVNENGTAYFVSRPVGEGGQFSRIRQAIDLETGARLIIKELRLSSRQGRDMRRAAEQGTEKSRPSYTHVNDLNREVELAKKSQSAAAPRDVIEVDGKVYLVLKRFRGDMVNFCGALSSPEFLAAAVRQVAEQIGSALSVLHDRGMLHRDIKPDNILLDDDGTMALADFGMAEEMDKRRQVGGVAGSVEYIAPEVLRDRVSKPAAEVYSLGHTLINLLAQEYLCASDPSCSTEAPLTLADATLFHRQFAEQYAAIRPDQETEISAAALKGSQLWRAHRAIRTAFECEPKLTLLILNQMIAPDPDWRATMAQLVLAVQSEKAQTQTMDLETVKLAIEWFMPKSEEQLVLDAYLEAHREVTLTARQL